jgi:hypothetical protein
VKQAGRVGGHADRQRRSKSGLVEIKTSVHTCLTHYDSDLSTDSPLPKGRDGAWVAARTGTYVRRIWTPRKSVICPLIRLVLGVAGKKKVDQEAGNSSVDSSVRSLPAASDDTVIVCASSSHPVGFSAKNSF